MAEAFVLRVLPDKYSIGSIKEGLFYHDAAYYDSDGDLEQADEFVESLVEATFYSDRQPAQDAADDLGVKLEIVPVTIQIVEELH